MAKKILTVEEAIPRVERKMRSIVKKCQTTIEEIGGVLQHGRANMSEKAITQAEAEIASHGRIVTYANYALANLPSDPRERLDRLKGHFETIEKLAEDERVEELVLAITARA
ncbi:hypothetical protein [Acidisoma sp. S159]|uniref:hypothetical protein n=1 Tax=Acidisoma sp. S159 TaxID=1747225 RepID=UPI00131C53E8|nr:hypothetical protein [Acidisoma sp. S159]